jgi:6-phosphogluconolactonase/glucosamine-6-phosphate isomerase/deaminase
MTMTPSVVNGARSRLMLIVGATKAEPLAGWISHDGALPVERVKRTNTTVVADAAAAARLGENGSR